MAAKTFLLYQKLHAVLWAWGEALWFCSLWWFSSAGDKYVTSVVIWMLFPQSLQKTFQITFPVYSTEHLQTRTRISELAAALRT